MSEALTYSEISETDLPILSNVHEVRVLHYILKLQFNFELRIVTGSVICFLQPRLKSCPKFSGTSTCHCPSKIMLDCCSIRVINVARIKPGKDMRNQGEDEDSRTDFDWFQAGEQEPVNFAVEKWCLTLSDWSCASERCGFPRVVRINYETMPGTPSLHWRPTRGFSYEESGNAKAVYTPASPVNNRGLFPCQEHPSAMATWECHVAVHQPYIPLLSSDEPGTLVCSDSDTSSGSGLRTYYFRTRHAMPMSTFAIVVGMFSEDGHVVVEPQSAAKHPAEIEKICTHIISGNLIPIRFFSLCSEFTWTRFAQFQEYSKNVLISAFNALGPHPFSRLDIVVMPPCFHTLSLANPHMIFVAHSVFTGSREPLFYSCFPHEVAHSWFGLSIGALDWTEEWLSEGFATFMEDSLYREAMQSTFPESLKFIENDVALKARIRLHKLQNELASSSSESESGLRKLVSNQAVADEEPLSVVKDGLNPVKGFTQVHYLKGYFFLNFLSQLVGLDQFMTFLKEYVRKFQSQLVTSAQFLTFYDDYFRADLKSNPDFTSASQLTEDWLRNPELLEPLRSADILSDAGPRDLFPKYKCLESLHKINTVYHELPLKPSTTILTSLELILLFEKILDSQSSWFTGLTLEELQTRLSINIVQHNPEVVHRFCEIILKFYAVRKSKATSRARSLSNHESEWCLDLLKEFLLQHPAMGVYLYGELMISEKSKLQQLARRLYSQQKQVLDPEARQVIHSMIF